jgi:hypothetical protein
MDSRNNPGTDKYAAHHAANQAGVGIASAHQAAPAMVVGAKASAAMRTMDSRHAATPEKGQARLRTAHISATRIDNVPVRDPDMHQRAKERARLVREGKSLIEAEILTRR